MTIKTDFMNSGEIENTINQLARDYESKVREELKEMIDEQDAQYHHDVIKQLMQMVSSNQSSWSGGHSVSNMLEQIKRQVASELLSDMLREDAMAARMEKAS